jgi:4-amino-4-deoxy-L-arabinose transferase-like glycosyltransferase
MKNYLSRNNIFLFLGISALTVIIGLVSIIKGSDFVGIFFSAFLFLGLFVFFAKYPDQTLSKIILLAFILRSGLAYFQRFIAPLPDSLKDAVAFEARAWEAAEAWIYGGEAIQLTGAYYYSQIIAWFYYLFERTPLVAQFLNVFLGTLIVFIVYKITRELFQGKKTAHIAAGIAAVFPTLNLYSAITMREVVIVFFLTLSFYFFARWIKNGKGKDCLLSLIFVFFSSIFHGAIILIGFTYIFFFIFYKPRKKRWVVISRQLVTGGVLVIIVFSLFYGYFHTKIPRVSEFTPERLERRLKIISAGRAQYLEGMVPKTYFDIVWQTPIRIVYFYFAPFPWQIKELLDVVGFIDILLYLFLFIFFFKSLNQIRKENKALFIALLLILIVFSITFAWGVSNYGSSLRHRQKIVFLLIIMASYSLSFVNWKKFLPKIK